MSKVISFMHISLDGFVAGPKGELDWVRVDQELFDYVGERISRCDLALYGRRTYQMMESYWPTAGDKPTATKHDIEHSAWYKRAHKAVISNSMKGMELANTTIISGNLPEGIDAIRKRTEGEILLFGSPTATRALMQQGLIDGFWLFVNPAILGQGIPLFTEIREKIKLNLLPPTWQFACGVTELNYAVDRQ